MEMTDTEKLLALVEIGELKARYCRLMDTKKWDEWGEVFAVDADLDTSEDVTPDIGDAKISGRAVIVEQVSRLVGQAATVHHVHSPEIEFTGPDAARGVWAMEDFVAWHDGVVSPIDPLRKMQGFGHYHETYVRRDGHWYIRSTKLTRLHRIMG